MFIKKKPKTINSKIFDQVSYNYPSMPMIEISVFNGDYLFCSHVRYVTQFCNFKNYLLIK